MTLPPPLTGPDDAPAMDWVLPADVHVTAAPSGTPTDPSIVLSYCELVRFNAIAPDTDAERWKYFNDDERAIAEFLQEKGVRVRSVREFKKRRPPDSITVVGNEPVEFKKLDPTVVRGYNHLTMLENVRGIGVKCRRGVVDARATTLTPDQAVGEVRTAVETHGVNLDELIMIVPSGSGAIAVSWRRGSV